MTTSETITIAVTLKNGQCFKHHPSPTIDKQDTFLAEIISELNKRPSGILTLTHPIGVYRLDDVSSIHLLETELTSEFPPMGFRIDRAIK